MSGTSITVTVTVGESRVTLEGPEDFVREEVRRLTDKVASGGTPAAARSVRSDVGRMSEADFVAEKSPSNHSETVAVLAYCLKQKGIEEFDKDEMGRAYKRARIRLPKVVDQAIRDARNVFDYVEAGSKRGSYRLSQHGETTVEFDLPRDASTRG
jgi:hypothetical protein